MFFFFQAEDGIRDADVTGVQTCALPICAELQPWCAEQGFCVIGVDTTRWWRHQRGSLSASQIDRKSTRLNSSHVRISYAVFCLKKKKIASSLTRCLIISSSFL